MCGLLNLDIEHQNAIDPTLCVLHQLRAKSFVIGVLSICGQRGPTVEIDREPVVVSAL